MDTPNSSHRIRRDPFVGQLIVKARTFFIGKRTLQIDGKESMNDLQDSGHNMDKISSDLP